MGNILSGLVLVNGTDIWTEYGVFLVDGHTDPEQGQKGYCRGYTGRARGKIQYCAHPTE